MDDAEARVQAMFARACFGAASDERLRRDLRAFLDEHGVDARDAEAIASQPPRLALYRRLVRNNVTGVTERMLARTRARMNEIGGAFDATLDAWMNEAGPRTHHLRDVPHEFLAWAEPRWRARRDLPAWLVDLARHELAEFAVGAAEGARERPEVAEVALDRPLVLAEPVRLARYAYAVHELPADADDRSVPREEPTALLAWRDDEDEVCSLSLGALAAAIVERAIAGEALGDAVKGACAALGVATSDAVLADVARLLETLGARGVLLGGKLSVMEQRHFDGEVGRAEVVADVVAVVVFHLRA